MQFKINKEPLKFSGWKKNPQPKPEPEATPEPAPETKPSYTPLKTDGLQGDHLRISRIVNWTGSVIYTKENPTIKDRQKNEVITLTQLCLEYLRAGEPAGRVLGRLENTIREIDPDFKPL